MTTPGERLKSVRENSGFETAKDAALAMGVPIATYTQHEKAERFLPARRASQYASFFRTTPEYLLYGRADAVPERVPILDPHGVDTGGMAILPPAPSDLTRAMLTTEGDGIAHLGFVALYDEPQAAKPTPDINGRLCVVAIVIDGVQKHVVRIVQRGASPNRYHLIGGSLPLIDQKIVWAAPVIALIPGHA
jgi:hypothetical protein